MDEPDFIQCPFCGAMEGKPEDCGPITMALNTERRKWSIDCLSCGACGPLADDMLGAAEKWNARAEIRHE